MDILQYGGIDNYVEKSSAKILGPEGLRIRLQIRDHLAQQEIEKPPRMKANQPPTLADARRAREQAMKALGLDSLPKYALDIPFKLVAVMNNAFSIALDRLLFS